MRIYRKILVCWCSAVILVGALSGAPLTADLGEQLRYVRADSVAEALPQLQELAASDRSTVLDLRYATTSPEDAQALAKLLRERRAGAQPWFVLVSPHTPVALEDAIGPVRRSLITLGVANSRPDPAVVVLQDLDTDRRAYDAFSDGISLDGLITGRIEKERYDEASLVRDFQNGVGVNPPQPPDPAKNVERASVLTDRVLQRAVHLHRAMQALLPARRGA
jgi:hypothetical protein